MGYYIRNKAKKRNIWEEAMDDQKAFEKQMVERNKIKHANKQSAVTTIFGWLLKITFYAIVLSALGVGKSKNK